MMSKSLLSFLFISFVKPKGKFQIQGWAMRQKKVKASAFGPPSYTSRPYIGGQFGEKWFLELRLTGLTHLQGVPKKTLF